MGPISWSSFNSCFPLYSTHSALWTKKRSPMACSRQCAGWFCGFSFLSAQRDILILIWGYSLLVEHIPSLERSTSVTKDPTCANQVFEFLPQWIYGTTWSRTTFFGLNPTYQKRTHVSEPSERACTKLKRIDHQWLMSFVIYSTGPI